MLSSFLSLPFFLFFSFFLKKENKRNYSRSISAFRAFLSFSCRAALCRESGKNVASASTSAISLDTLEEVLWWARFGDRDYKSLGSTNLRASVTLRELLLILGAAQEDASSGCSGGSGTLCLAPGCPAVRQPFFFLPTNLDKRVCLPHI